ncbi:restriction endonuclease subunit S [Bacillus thermotolerans]|uniref:restriction endonuclease subunit S n=1 Tax=Bacillus thermotolerans TaxID=1221996 RepID=UPI00058933B9|nr:restriction endonuclease subunit S [Bacillus thermotolerans]KKB42087.1 Restriction endonuclease [Bacillus thermotolerans]
MILSDWASISHGATLSRIECRSFDDSVQLPLYTMKTMHDCLGIQTSNDSAEEQIVQVERRKASDLPVSNERMVLMNLTSHQAAAIQSEHAGKVITSNFAIIEPSHFLDPMYLEWYLNEHPDCKKQLLIATQGSRIAALSIKLLRSLPIQLPSIETQRRIGCTYKLMQRKKKLINKRLYLEEKVMKQLALQQLKGEQT